MRPEDLAALRGALDARELVYVATCNRVEAYFALDSRGPGAAPDPVELARKAAEFFAERAELGFEHDHRHRHRTGDWHRSAAQGV